MAVYYIFMKNGVQCGQVRVVGEFRSLRRAKKAARQKAGATALKAAHLSTRVLPAASPFPCSSGRRGLSFTYGPTDECNTWFQRLASLKKVESRSALLLVRLVAGIPCGKPRNRPLRWRLQSLAGLRGPARRIAQSGVVNRALTSTGMSIFLRSFGL